MMHLDKSVLSIIIPMYNEEKNVEKILSILDQQSVSGFEVIVVDDGSTDNTALLVAGFKPTKYSLVLLQQSNMGAAHARETAINKSSSKYIAVIDCDDSIATNTLEKAIEPLLKDSYINISLFRLNYIDSIGSEVSRVFTYYTDRKLLDGVDTFNNCIRTWGIHAFGIYKREIIRQAYNIYYELNIVRENFLNNDEIISRIAFDISCKIILTEADYYFVRNLHSTTRRINKNYFKVINNVFFLSEYIENKRGSQPSLDDISSVHALAISTIWGVTVRFIQWRRLLNEIDRYQWMALINKAYAEIIKKGKEKKISINIKSKFKLHIIRYLTLKYTRDH